MPTMYKKLSPGEFETLKILWQIGGGTVAEVREAHRDPQGFRPAYTTTMTVLGRLVEKEAAGVERDKQPFVYRALMNRNAVLKRRLREFVGTCYGDDSELLLRHLLDDGHVESGELRALLGDES